MAGGGGNSKMSEGGQRVQTCHYKINKPWDVTCNMGSVVNNTVLHIGKLLRE